MIQKRPTIIPRDEDMVKKCRRCGADFVTRSRIRKRCDTCQKDVASEKQKKANQRFKKRRVAAERLHNPNR